MQEEISEFTAALHQGVQAGLKYLNSRTPHRYTGIWRFDGETLRSEALYDRFNLALQRGEDAPLAATYCSLVGRQQASLSIGDAATDPRAQGVDTPVMSYCGVLIRDAQGQPFGTLCHHDTDRCQPRTGDLPLLEAAASLFYQQLFSSNSSPGQGSTS